MQYVFFTINRNQRKHLSTAWGLGGSILPEILFEDPAPPRNMEEAVNIS